MQEWEYAILHNLQGDWEDSAGVKGKGDLHGRNKLLSIYERLNQLGAEGWEITGVGGGDIRYTIFLKRPNP